MLFRSYRLGHEGAETKGGDKMLTKDEINTLNLVAAAFGFQSSRLARIQEKNFAMQKEVQQMETERTHLLKRLDELVVKPEADKADIRKIMKEINEYNKRYPIEEYIIDDDAIEKSLDTFMERKGTTFRGQYMPEKLMPYLAPGYRATKPLE